MKFVFIVLAGIMVMVLIGVLMTEVVFAISLLAHGWNLRTERVAIISLIIGIGMMMGIITITNIIFKKPTTMEMVIISVGILIATFALYALSYFLTAWIYSRKEL